MYLKTIRFFYFLLYVYIEINDPQGVDNFDPRAIIWTILLEFYNTMFHAKYLTFSICQLLEDFFLKFLLYTYKENQWPLGRADFDPKGYNLNNLGKGLPDDALCKISKL